MHHYIAELKNVIFMQIDEGKKACRGERRGYQNEIVFVEKHRRWNEVCIIIFKSLTSALRVSFKIMESYVSFWEQYYCLCETWHKLKL